MTDDGHLKIRLKRALGDWRWMPFAVLGMGVLSIGLLIISDRIHEKMVARDLLLVCAVSDLRAQAATSHLWMKEFVSGAPTNRDQISERLDAASQISDSLLWGGAVHQQAIQPIDDPALRKQAEEIREQIEKLRTLTLDRKAAYERGEDVGIGSAVDAEHDEAFYALTDMDMMLEKQIVMRVQSNQQQARLLFRTILIAWVLIVSMAVTGLWSRERRRRQAEAALRDSEAQLLQAQKMEAVGRLAGGIAHDINNYLAAINAQCELMRMKAEPDSRLAHKMDLVIATTGRASTLIKRLLAFSRRQPVQPQVVRLNRVVDGLGNLMTRLIGEDVTLETTFDPNLWNVRMDPSQIEQVLVNLLVNAREAMPVGGTIRVDCSNHTFDGAYAEAHPVTRAGDYVLLSVGDDGTGIDPEIQDKIFEPFFTTKEDAGRSGLGLATVYGIVRQNGGIISVRSRLGEGTVVEVCLPRSLEEETTIAVPTAAAAPVGAGGRERILLVEDNDDLRDSTRGVLEALGYYVQVAANGEEALRLYDSQASEIDLLITDVVMPGMSGREVMDRIRERKKDLNVIFISGYTDNVILRHGIRDGEFEFLQKPFSAESLASKIRQVLRRAAPREPAAAQPLPATS